MPAKRLSGRALADAISSRIGYSFDDTERLERALTHASARSSSGTDYERLEFLGDRVLGLVIAELLFRTFPGAPEGELAVRLNALVSGQTCAEVANEVGLAEFIRAEATVAALKGNKGRSVRADAMEALIAAIYLDGGIDAVRPFILRYWEPRSRAASGAWRDPKTELQEWAHQSFSVTPAYKVENREGPDHEPVFTVRVEIAGLAPARGTGKAKREAEQAAATEILLREGVWKEGERG